MLIIPGTKNTLGDLKWLVARRFDHFIAHHIERRGWVLGICGGYQMLGRNIADPFGVEDGGSMAGLGLLAVETELHTEKATSRSSGRSFLCTPVNGYEIHMGRTQIQESAIPFIIKDDGSADGLVTGRVGGTYFHGLFDNPEFTTEFLTLVAKQKGLDWRPQAMRNRKKTEYDRLADVVRKHLDIPRIRELIQ